MKNPVARKLGMNSGMRALIITPPPGYLKLLAPLHHGRNVSSRATGVYPFVQVFATRLSEISRFAGRLSKHAAPNALVWISYPKKTSKVEGDLSRDVIREAMRAGGMARRVHRCHRRGVVSIALPASGPLGFASKART